MDNELTVVIAAAGSGKRMKAEINKQYMPMAGQPLLNYSLDVFERSDLVKGIIIVVQENELDYCKNEVIKGRGYKKIAGIIPGGARRQDSVWAGLQYLDDQTGLVAVHDGSRPFVTLPLIARLAEEAERWGAAIPGRPAYETLKLVDQELLVKKTLDRSVIWAIQTPQVFRCPELKEAYKKAIQEGFNATDDASLYERYISRVKVVPGEESNIKITTPEDLLRAEFIIERKGI